MKTDYIYNIQVYDLPAGVFLDSLIATKVMGWHLIPEEDSTPEEKNSGILQWAEMWFDTNNKLMYNRFHPSRNIFDAWEVVKKIGQTYRINVSVEDGLFSCKISKRVRDDGIYEMLTEQIHESAPLAICRAALLWTTIKK